MSQREFKVLHLFAGIGGGALGFSRAHAEYRGIKGSFRTIGAIDNNGPACRDFEKLTGVPATCADIATMTPADMRAATKGEAPDVVFSSPPCKGFSGLLGNAAAASEKYQKLNRLVLQGVWLVLETWPDDLPSLILMENVPRITQRGAVLLEQVKSMLIARGYRFDERLHDCGELGGLAQHRRRYLLAARHEKKLPTMVYSPPSLRVRSVGEVIGPLPMPDDPSCGPMHRLPRLAWKTWVRLALIPAGKDWRALGRRDGTGFSSAYGIVPWDDASGVVTGNGRPGGGAFSVADPRLDGAGTPYNNVYRIVQWDEASPAVTGGGTPTSGGVCIADPRPNCHSRNGTMRVMPWDEPGDTVTGSSDIHAGTSAVADPRPRTHHNIYRVHEWEKPSGTVIGATRPGSGAIAINDPRLPYVDAANANKFRVTGFDEPAGTVTSALQPSTGAIAIGDPRIDAKAGSYNDLLGVLAWDQPAKTISGNASVSGSNCPAAVADPRIPLDNDVPDPPPIIIALDGTWHRPLTTMELAALQSFDVPIPLDGKSHTSWRERIGNAVPPAAAHGMAEAFLVALLQGASGQTFALGSTDVWVDCPRCEGHGVVGRALAPCARCGTSGECPASEVL